MNTLTAIGHILSPVNVMAALGARAQLETRFGRTVHLQLVYLNPSDDSELVESLFDVIETMLAGFEGVTLLRLDAVDDDAASIVTTLGTGGADFILYAHDVVTTWPQSLARAYPMAKTVCYGDALGQFFERPDGQGAAARGRRIPRLLWRLLARLRGRKGASPQSVPAFRPKIFAAILPVAQKPLPAGIQLMVPDKDSVAKIARQCALNCAGLQNYCAALANECGSDATLFLTGNMAEAQFVSFEDEMRFYTDTILRNCAPGSTVIIKPHAHETQARIFDFREILGGAFTIRQIDKKYARYPVELFLPLLQKCSVIGMYYPVLSLKYLYDIDVVQPLDDKAIEKYFPRAVWAPCKEAVLLNMQPLARLQGWNGISLLYNGQ